MINYDDFAKIELKTGKVISAEPIEESEKLIKLMVDVGEESHRQILAGIKQYYEPDALVGKTIIIVANLEPRKMMGLESQGMLLAADADKPILLTVSEPVDPGAKIR